MINAAEYAAYDRTLNAVSDDLRNGVDNIISRLTAAGAPLNVVRDSVVEYLESYAPAYVEAAQFLGAEAYEAMTGFKPVPGKPIDPNIFKSVVHAVAGNYMDGGTAEMFARVVGDATERIITRSANTVVIDSAVNNRVRFARVPNPGACKFCLMLGSRGFVYASSDSAGEFNQYHDGCKCRIVASNEKTPHLDGYDPDALYEQWKNAETNTRKSAKPVKVEPVSNGTADYDNFMKRIEADNIKYHDVEKWDKLPDTQSIVDVLAGGDLTTGSCSSLAFAYFGNKAGNMVRDFRGGKSQNLFSVNYHIREISKFNGVSAISEMHMNAFKAANKAFEHVEPGKEYYFTVGRHAAVIRSNPEDGVIEYLEMQSGNAEKNTWHEMTDSELKWRFSCTKSRTIMGMKVEQEALLIDGESLMNSDEFNSILGYINTPEDMQQKGTRGHVR